MGFGYEKRTLQVRIGKIQLDSAVLIKPKSHQANNWPKEILAFA